MHHILKIKSNYFDHIQEGKKTFEVRYNDRDYQVGDTLSFINEDMDPNDHSYKIIYIHQGLGMAEGYVVLSIKLEENEFDEPDDSNYFDMEY